MHPLRLGTRGSELAMVQSGLVAQLVTEKTGREVELVTIRTKGDRIVDRPLSQIGGKGLFTKAIEDAIIDGTVDFAVHSMKDMPSEQPDELVIGAVPPRADPRDGLVGRKLGDLPAGSVVGTGSARRLMQIRRLRPDIEVRGIRGNVDTRINKQRSGDYDAVVLAMAGLSRLGRLDEVVQVFAPDEMIPAVGQGALAIQCRREGPVQEIISAVHHEPTAICIAAERAFLETLCGGCSVPAGAYAELVEDEIVLRAFYASDEDFRSVTLRTDSLHVVPMGQEAARRVR
ncbi:MAG: hydroxymethylbilane synthase [Proteobacteria bacterium]|jgi:hydroxymethylbilane synthase|nr:hydroxymethylbilane synthase [Pseudomonadota bacterium]